MTPDLAVDLIKATVQLEQPLGNGTKTVGTGFLVNAPTPDGKPRTVLITSGHVFDRMPHPEARIGWRVSSTTTDWRYAPATFTIRAGGVQNGAALWTRHPTQDVAAMTVQAPPEFVKAAIPLAWLADDATFTRYDVRPGDEMMALGFPKGLSSNRAGFPILRWGRVASYPLTPASSFPNFLLDFRVFDGNSGGPVFMADPRRSAAGAKEPGAYFVAGVLTKQVESQGDRLEIGVVTHAKHVREAIALLDSQAAPPPRVTAAPAPARVQPPATAPPTGGAP
jgi:S1-C subfamily serine protease